MACTGVSASWCPHCGDCTCPRLDTGEPEVRVAEEPTIFRPWPKTYVVHNPSCPLHGTDSQHCAPDPRNLSLFPEDDA